MFDINSLPISGGVITAGIVWAVFSGFVLADVVAERTIANSGWEASCEQDLRANITVQRPQAKTSTPNLSCDALMGVIGNGAGQLCDQGGDLLFNLMTIDPLTHQKEQMRQREEERLSRIADLAPSRCSCAANVVGADRLMWGLFAGTARLAGGPKNLQSDLTQALHSPACALKLED